MKDTRFGGKDNRGGDAPSSGCLVLYPPLPFCRASSVLSISASSSSPRTVISAYDGALCCLKALEWQSLLGVKNRLRFIPISLKLFSKPPVEPPLFENRARLDCQRSLRHTSVHPNGALLFACAPLSPMEFSTQSCASEEHNPRSCKGDSGARTPIWGCPLFAPRRSLYFLNALCGPVCLMQLGPLMRPQRLVPRPQRPRSAPLFGGSVPCCH